MKKVNIAEKLGLFSELWTPKVLAQVNGVQVRLAKLHGEFPWHEHPHEDELFLVLDGCLRLEFRDGDLLLEAGELAVVPRGVEHRPSADEETHVLLVEPASTVNTGSMRNERTLEVLEWI